MSYKKYAKDYKSRLVSVNDGRGMKEVFVYTGDYFTAGIRTGERKKVVRLLAACCAGSILCFVAAGLINCGGMLMLYVAVPFVVTLLPLGMLAAGVWRCISEKEPLKREAVDHSWRRTGGMSMFAAIMGGATALLSVLYMLLSGDFSGGQLLFTFLMALVGGLTGWIRLTIRKKCDIHQLEDTESVQNS